MFQAVDSPYLVPFDESFSVQKINTGPPRGAPDKEECGRELKERIEQLRDLQDRLYASDKHSVLLIFQALDAAGKDGTIEAVMSGVNPTGCQVYSFKAPTPEELDHDFLWRTTCRLPERGRIGIFNRSYYEEVLAVRVHPEYLDAQKLPYELKRRELWEQRFESIRDHERHLARSGTVVVKFWLNVGYQEQGQRLLKRIDDPAKNWKFSHQDVGERAHWGDYMEAFEDALKATSRPHAPWYAVPADSKPFMRLCVADILVRSLDSLDLRYPELPADERARLAEARKILEDERG